MIKALKREIVRDVMDKKTKLSHVVLFLFSNHETLKDYFFIKNLRIREFFLLS